MKEPEEKELSNLAFGIKEIGVMITLWWEYIKCWFRGHDYNLVLRGLDVHWQDKKVCLMYCKHCMSVDYYDVRVSHEVINDFGVQGIANNVDLLAEDFHRKTVGKIESKFFHGDNYGITKSPIYKEKDE